MADSSSSPRRAAAGITVHDLYPAADSLRDDVLTGLAGAPKHVPPKYFYDEAGCHLFEAICETPEYRVTRSETELMRREVAQMARCLGPDCLLVEYGSGNGRKTRILLEALRPAVYMPIDIARDQLLASARRLTSEFPWLQVEAVWGDYSGPLALTPPAAGKGLRRVIYFPGSSIGNFTPAEAVQFLERAAQAAGAGGAMLVGVDLKKPVDLLNAAYNDAQGVTARFNLNLLTRINRELGADFDVAAFRHVAFYNQSLGRIEMHLASSAARRVTLLGRSFEFFAGEAIHTENSYKYSVQEFQSLGRSAGYQPKRVWISEDGGFAVHYLALPG